MKITKHGIEAEIKKGMIWPQEDYGVLTVEEFSKKLSCYYNRQVKNLYIVEDDRCSPALLVQWSWRTNEDEEYSIFDITCSVEEEALLRRIGVL